MSKRNQKTAPAPPSATAIEPEPKLASNESANEAVNALMGALKILADTQAETSKEVISLNRRLAETFRMMDSTLTGIYGILSDVVTLHGAKPAGERPQEIAIAAKQLLLAKAVDKALREHTGQIQ